MQQAVLLFADMPLKHFLLLFDAGAPLASLAFGDTMHPSSGYVEMEILPVVEVVSQLLAFKYNFEGLVCFEAVIQDMTVTYLAEGYRVEGSSKAIAKLKSKAKNLNHLSDAPHFTIVSSR